MSKKKALKSLQLQSGPTRTFGPLPWSHGSFSHFGTDERSKSIFSPTSAPSLSEVQEYCNSCTTIYYYIFVWLYINLFERWIDQMVVRQREHFSVHSSLGSRKSHAIFKVLFICHQICHKKVQLWSYLVQLI
jgi:hypothetical protein